VSAAVVVILPRLWVCSAQPTRPSGHPVTVLARRPPHRLQLVRAAAEELQAPVPELAFYRKYTEGMLRRYQTMSMEAGRVPSLLGREMFRGKVTSYKVRGFDDVVIFTHDVGQCLKRLTPAEQHLIRRIALQQYTQGETAAMLGVSLRTVVRRYAGALDALTRLFLERKMLEPLEG
jgi:predicted DNA-binding protein (UPF0251 family)